MYKHYLRFSCLKVLILYIYLPIVHLIGVVKQFKIFSTPLNLTLLEQIGPSIIKKHGFEIIILFFLKFIYTTCEFHRLDPKYSQISKLTLIYACITGLIKENHPFFHLKYACKCFQSYLFRKRIV